MHGTSGQLQITRRWEQRNKKTKEQNNDAARKAPEALGRGSWHRMNLTIGTVFFSSGIMTRWQRRLFSESKVSFSIYFGMRS